MKIEMTTNLLNEKFKLAEANVGVFDEKGEIVKDFKEEDFEKYGNYFISINLLGKTKNGYYIVLTFNRNGDNKKITNFYLINDGKIDNLLDREVNNDVMRISEEYFDKIFTGNDGFIEVKYKGITFTIVHDDIYNNNHTGEPVVTYGGEDIDYYDYYMDVDSNSNEDKPINDPVVYDYLNKLDDYIYEIDTEICGFYVNFEFRKPKKIFILLAGEENPYSFYNLTIDDNNTVTIETDILEKDLVVDIGNIKFVIKHVDL